MKRIWIQIFIVIIGVILCISAHNGVKKYFYKNYFEDINYIIVYNNFSNVSFNSNLVEQTTTTTATTTITTKTTTTKPITKSTKKLTTTKSTTTNITTTNVLITTTQKADIIEDSPIKENELNNDKIIYDGLTLKELTEKLNKNLNSTISNTGHHFANYYVETGLDPYLAVAIVLQETGCKWTCSKLVRECNNIGGMKGTPSCNGGSYMRYDTLEEGIYGYLNMLNNNYYAKGLTTPELMNPKYAASKEWSVNVNKYIENIKAS